MRHNMTLRFKRSLGPVLYGALSVAMALSAFEPRAIAQQTPTDAQILDALTA
jgi:hypothetical protein